MKERWCLSLLLMANFYLGLRGDLQCLQTEKCDCYNFAQLQYQCPRNDYQVLIQTIPGKNVKIECDIGSEFNLDMLPDIHLGDLDNFLMRFCPLPANGFNEILNKFKIGRIKTMKLEGMYTNRSISRQLFYGLTSLGQLDLKSFRTEFEEDFLQYLPNLRILDLEYNKIQEVTAKMFNYVPRLGTLYLSDNFISDLPDGVFQHLSNLQHLYLTKNLISTLKRMSFIGLKHLKSLDLLRNKITSLEDGTFAELVELKKLNLAENNVQKISSNTFKHNGALELVLIGYNPNLILSDYVFANLTKLLRVNIDNSNQKSIPEHVFHGCTELVEISLKNNNITELSETVFENLNNLKRLYLNGNKIKILPSHIFSSLKSLEQLYLQDNELEEIHDNVCRRATNLVTLNLSFNRISTKDIVDPFKYCESLHSLDLSHNKIEVFPDYIMSNKTHLKFLDLSYNQISRIRLASLLIKSPEFIEVSLKNNNVSVLDFEEIKQHVRANKIFTNTRHKTVLYLQNNPIKCDCHNFDLIQYYNDAMDPTVKSMVDIKVGNLRCATPESLIKIPVIKLKSNNIICPLFGTRCPKECECSYRPSDKHALVNCSNRNLTKCPSINLGYDKILVNLEGNFIERAPYAGLGYDNVTELYLSNNRIKNVSWIPPKIEMLTLNGNHLKFIDPKVLVNLNQSRTIKYLELHGNPWSCNCDATAFQNFLETHYTKVKSNAVICEDTKKPLIDERDLCKSQLTTTMTIVMPVLVVLLIATTLLALYFYYKNQIKIWLYAKSLCLWWVTEEELDRDKTYDVFISYSHKDEGFVIQNLLPVLEQGPDPYKVCIHNRDWIPGEFIAKQVTDSVLDSRRTLVVLSESFLESVWGKMEFRAAHTQAINEGRARVIVLKYGTLNEQNLDNELRAYLKTNTYVEWGDPWFWYKLKYALPHSKRSRFFDNNANKHPNVMLNIDEKFEYGKFSMKSCDSLEGKVKTKTNGVSSGIPLIVR